MEAEKCLSSLKIRERNRLFLSLFCKEFLSMILKQKNTKNKTLNICIYRKDKANEVPSYYSLTLI